MRPPEVARQVADAHKKVFRKRLCELAAGEGARRPAVLGDTPEVLPGMVVTLRRRNFHFFPALNRWPARAAGARDEELFQR